MTLNLNLFIYPGGHHEAAWRYRELRARAGPRHLLLPGRSRSRPRPRRSTSIFFADGPSLADNIRYAARFRLEPLTWMSAIAAVTSRIGLIGTASTTYSEPYNLARQFASLDHLSTAARAGTSSPPAPRTRPRTSASPSTRCTPSATRGPRSTSRSSPSCGTAGRTRRWSADPESGVFADTDLIHAIEHVGQHFKVAGPLNTAAPPAGPAGLRAGRLVGGRPRLRGPVGRGDLHRAPDARERPGVLRRHQVAGARASGATRNS